MNILQVILASTRTSTSTQYCETSITNAMKIRALYACVISILRSPTVVQYELASLLGFHYEKKRKKKKKERNNWLNAMRLVVT